MKHASYVDKRGTVPNWCHSMSKSRPHSPTSTGDIITASRTIASA